MKAAECVASARVLAVRAGDYEDGRSVVVEALGQSGEKLSEITKHLQHCAEFDCAGDDAELGRMFREIVLPYALSVAEARGIVGEAAADLAEADQEAA